MFSHTRTALTAALLSAALVAGLTSIRIGRRLRPAEHPYGLGLLLAGNGVVAALAQAMALGWSRRRRCAARGLALDQNTLLMVSCSAVLPRNLPLAGEA